MNEEEMKSLKLRVDKLTCGMTEEETDALSKEILAKECGNIYEDSLGKNFSSDEMVAYIKDLQKCIDERINEAIKELLNLKDMIYEPETREINFDVQRKISSIIKILGSDEK